MTEFRRFNLDIIKIQLLVIVLCAIVVNANTLSNGFVYDDMTQIVNNRWITNIKYIPEIFGNDATHAEMKGISNYYRPMMNVIYLVNYYVFAGLKPWGFHLVNILFHVAVTILVFLIASLLMRDVKLTRSTSFLSVPFVSALIFAVHPIHAEVVAWVACVPELSFTFFCLLSLYFHMKSSQNFDQGHVWSLVFFSFAMLCKETTVALLPLLALYNCIYRTEKFDIRRSVMRYLPFVVIVGVYSILRFNALSGMAPLNRVHDLTTYEEIINVLPLFSQYLQKLLLPINLNAFYVLHPIHSIADHVWIFSLVIVIAFVLFGYVLFKRCKSSFFGLLMMTIPLLPVLYIRKLGENTFAERYLYFSSIGFALIVGSLFTIKVINKDHWRKPFIVLFLAVMVAYSCLTINRNTIWHDELGLFADTIQKSPDSYSIHNNLGNALADKGNLDASILEYKASLRINPIYTDGYFNLGYAHFRKGDWDAAIRAFQEVLQIDPNFTDARFYIGNALARKGNLDAAIHEYQEVLRINPNHLKANIKLREVQMISPNGKETHIN